MSLVDRPLDRVDGDVRRAFAAEDADAVDVGLRRDAGADPPAVAADRGRVVGARVRGARSGHTRAGSGAGDVRAVPVAVERVRVRMRNRLVRRVGVVGVVVVADEVDAALDAEAPTVDRHRRQRVDGVGRLERGDRAGTGEVRVREVDTGVDHGDLDVLAVQAGQAAPHRRSTDQRDALDVVRDHLREAADSGDAVQRRQLGQLLAVDPDLDAVVGELIVGEHLAAEVLDRTGEAVLLALQVGLDRRLLCVGERAGRLGLDNRHRLVRKLDDDGRLAVAEANRRPLSVDDALGSACLRRAGRRAPRYDRQGNERQQSRCYERASRAPGSESHMCLSPVSKSESRPDGRLLLPQARRMLCGMRRGRKGSLHLHPGGFSASRGAGVSRPLGCCCPVVRACGSTAACGRGRPCRCRSPRDPGTACSARGRRTSRCASASRSTPG